ncbi:MAG TPA: prepilin-type N-terminal cleavage/methylation domain-containing protein [Gemmatimonadaceae bacterium]|nr:prepilin-type N-terminal cleavage/methylation domain-containing protein [Gemmatimonadaceae bacterium]
MRMRCVVRSGTTLVELLVVLTIGAVLAGIFARTVITQRRAEQRSADALERDVAVDEALAVLTSALARAAGTDSLTVRADTALELRATVGIAVACVAAADSVVVPDSGSAAWWEASPDTADTAELGDASGAWVARRVVLVRALGPGGPCAASHHTLKLAAGAAFGAAPLVRTTRRLRFMLYKGGEGLWWLGERACSGAPLKCDAAQPIAGPLSAPPAGLRITIDSSSGAKRVSITAASGTATRSVSVVVPP